MNGLFCGPGSLEIVFDYWGPDLGQKPIANVARTSSIGTWTHDLQRAGHFSSLSSAQGWYFPNVGPEAGFPERPLGLASFAFASDTLWLDGLKALIAADIPVIMLMHYAPDSVSGGHYRVAIGYDDAQEILYFSDPWGRDLRYVPGLPGVLAWTYEELAVGWDYVAYGTPLPFYGVAMMPWQVDVGLKGKVKPGATLTVTATITYPCPPPFDATQFPAEAATATISLPQGLTLLTPPTLELGTLPAGSTCTATWTVGVDTLLPGAVITVEAGGLVSGSVPETQWQGQSMAYPPYTYTDRIGGAGSVTP
jgi:hypothetical protein